MKQEKWERLKKWWVTPSGPPQFNWEPSPKTGFQMMVFNLISLGLALLINKFL